MQLFKGLVSLVPMERAEGQSVVNRILAGDTTAARWLINSHQSLVSQIVARVIPNPTDREDLAQDIFLKVFEKLDTYAGNAKLSTWIARIAFNTCLNWKEKKRAVLYSDIAPDASLTVDDCPADGEDPEVVAVQRHTASTLCAAIDNLPVIYGLILSLYHLQEMTYREIGEILQMPDGTVKSYLFRARKLLKADLTRRYTVDELCA